MSALRASNRFCDRDPDLRVGAITCRRFAPLPYEAGVMSQMLNEGCLITHSHNLTGGESRGPGPLKVVATQLAGHVHHFADKVEPGNAPGFHCL